MKYSKDFMKVFGDSLNATYGKPATYFETKRVRFGKTAKKHKKSEK